MDTVDGMLVQAGVFDGDTSARKSTIKGGDEGFSVQLSEGRLDENVKKGNLLRRGLLMGIADQQQPLEQEKAETQGSDQGSDGAMLTDLRYTARSGPGILMGRPVWVKTDDSRVVQPQQQQNPKTTISERKEWVTDWGEGDNSTTVSIKAESSNVVHVEVNQGLTFPSGQTEKAHHELSQKQGQLCDPPLSRVNRISLGKIVWGIELLDPDAYSRWTQHDWIGSVLQLYR